MDHETQTAKYRDLDHAVHNRDGAYKSDDRIQCGRNHYKAPVGVGRPAKNCLYDQQTTEVTLSLARAVGYVVRRSGKCPCPKTARLISSWPDLDLALASVPDNESWEALKRKAKGFAATVRLTDSLLHSAKLYREQLATERKGVAQDGDLKPKPRVEPLPNRPKLSLRQADTEAAAKPTADAREREQALMDAAMHEMAAQAKAAPAPTKPADAVADALAKSAAEDARNQAAFDALDGEIEDGDL